MDVTMPDGTVIEGVPEGTTKAQLAAKYQAHLSGGGQQQPADAPTQLGPLAPVVGLGEAALAGATGMGSTLLAGGFNALSMLRGTKARDASAAADQTVGDLTYQPRTEMGRQFSQFAAMPFEGWNQIGKLAREKIGVETPARARLGAAIDIASQLGPQALAVAAPMSRGAVKPKVVQTTVGDKVPGSAFIDRHSSFFPKAMQEAAAKRQAMRIERNAVGGPETRQAIYNATSKPVDFVPKIQERGGPTTGESVAHIPEATDIIALQDAVSRRSESPIGVDSPAMKFARKKADQIANREAAIKARKAVTDPMRELALTSANEVTKRFSDLKNAVVDRFYSKASGLQDKGRFDTFAADQTTRLQDYPNQPMRSEPLRFRKNIANAENAASETTPIIRQRQSELASAERQLKQLEDAGASPLEIESLTRKISGMRNTPGNFSTDIVRTTMDKVAEKLKVSAEKFGTKNPDGTITPRMDARELYAIRKQIGKDIQDAQGPNVKPDRKFNALLERSIQEAFDESIEAAGGTGWKAYLAEYAKRSEAIKADINRTKMMEKPLQRSTVESTDTPAGMAGGGSFNMLSRPMMAANALLRQAGKKVPARVLQQLADDLLNPEKFAENIKPAQIIESRRLGNALVKRYGLAQPAVMGNAFAKPNENKLQSQQ